MRREFSDAVKDLAMLRARFRCELCSSRTRKELQLHHIGNPMDNSLFNAQVLCEDCHVNVHREMKGLPPR